VRVLAREKKSMLEEFKKFACGNVIELAVGVTIGAAFGAIVFPSTMTLSCRSPAQ
jgi:large-conductance mechanosensitive channel